MFSNLKYRLQPLGLLMAGLIIVMLLTSLGGIWHYQHELSSQSGVKIPGINLSGKSPLAADTKNKETIKTQSGDSSNQASSNSAKPKSTQQIPNSSPSQNNSALVSSNEKTKLALIKLSLSVNGHFKGSVKLTSGSNQCDLLSQAYANGIISSLDMRYSSQYKTKAVYVIDGIGDREAIWWTYKVNGTAPPYGCSTMPAHNGDSVNWQYIKS